MFLDEKTCPCCGLSLSFAETAAEEYCRMGDEYVYGTSEATYYYAKADHLAFFDYYCFACDIGFQEQDVDTARRQMRLGEYRPMMGTGKTDIALGLAQN
ncbi:hypothetical protein KU306_12190 [Haloferax larsenii]|uniref:Uncharacterized protein n=1 Tax=Haloferax larsenii TaxID=302484 RepID=A0ABY5RBD3_HALLR|nr:hypothetical protein [Haloferax larsenii]UVE49664.1 hypothetical protein KU306_12190 [Haloferax larsenii]